MGDSMRFLGTLEGRGRKETRPKDSVLLTPRDI